MSRKQGRTIQEAGGKIKLRQLRARFPRIDEGQINLSQLCLMRSGLGFVLLEKILKFLNAGSERFVGVIAGFF